MVTGARYCKHGVSLDALCKVCNAEKNALFAKLDTDIAKIKPQPSVLPEDAQARKAIPLATGLLDYFPDALAAVAELSWLGNEKHNPGEPLHWSRNKSNDHADCAIRHFMQRGTFDDSWAPKKVRHLTQAAWRILALLQLEIEAARQADS